MPYRRLQQHNRDFSLARYAPHPIYHQYGSISSQSSTTFIENSMSNPVQPLQSERIVRNSTENLINRENLVNYLYNCSIEGINPCRAIGRQNLLYFLNETIFNSPEDFEKCVYGLLGIEERTENEELLNALFTRINREIISLKTYERWLRTLLNYSGRNKLILTSSNLFKTLFIQYNDIISAQNSTIPENNVLLLADIIFSHIDKFSTETAKSVCANLVRYISNVPGPPSIELIKAVLAKRNKLNFFVYIARFSHFVKVAEILILKMEENIDAIDINSISTHDFALTMFGLNRLPSDSAHSTKLVNMFIKLILRANGLWQIEDSEDLHNILSGLKLLKIERKEVRELVSLINNMISSNVSVSGSCFEIADLLGCLRGQSEAYNESIILANKVINALPRDLIFDTFEIAGTAMSGMIGFSANYEGAQTVISYVTRSLSSPTFKNVYIKIDSLVKLLSGLTKMSPSQSPVVSDLLYAISAKIYSVNLPFNIRDFSLAIRSFQSMSLETNSSYIMLASIYQKHSRYRNVMDVKITAENIIDILTGLRNKNTNYKVVTDILMLMAEVIEKTGFISITPEQFSTIFHSLAGLSCEESRYNEMVPYNSSTHNSTFTSFGVKKAPNPRALITFINQISVHYRKRSPLTPDQVAHALYGLQGLGRDYVVKSLDSVYWLMQQFIQDIKLDAQKSFTPESVSKALSGLRHFNNEEVTVQLLLKWIAHLTKNIDSIPPNLIADCWIGFQNKNMSNSFVEYTFRVLFSRIEAYNGSLTLTGKDIADCLWAARHMDDKQAIVRRLMGYMAIKINESSADMTSEEIGTALQSLHNRTLTSYDARSLVFALALKIAATSAQLTSTQVRQAMYGMSEYFHTHEANALLRCIANNIKKQPKHMYAAFLEDLKADEQLRNSFFKALKMAEFIELPKWILKATNLIGDDDSSRDS